MDEQKILDTLKNIQDICFTHDCKNCPLSNEYGKCILQAYPPCVWKLNDKLPKKWTAFMID